MGDILSAIETALAKVPLAEPDNLISDLHRRRDELNQYHLDGYTCSLLKLPSKLPEPSLPRLPAMLREGFDPALRDEIQSLWAAYSEAMALCNGTLSPGAVRAEQARRHAEFTSNPTKGKVPEAFEAVYDEFLKRRLAVMRRFSIDHGEAFFRLHRAAISHIIVGLEKLIRWATEQEESADEFFGVEKSFREVSGVVRALLAEHRKWTSSLSDFERKEAEYLKTVNFAHIRASELHINKEIFEAVGVVPPERKPAPAEEITTTTTPKGKKAHANR